MSTTKPSTFTVLPDASTQYPSFLVATSLQRMGFGDIKMTRNELMTWRQSKNHARMLLVRTLVLATGVSLFAPSVWAQRLQQGIAHRVEALEDRVIELTNENAELRRQLANWHLSQAWLISSS